MIDAALEDTGTSSSVLRFYISSYEKIQEEKEEEEEEEGGGLFQEYASKIEIETLTKYC